MEGEEKLSQKRYEDLTFTDDFLFCKILSNNEVLCKELLELILDIKIRKVVVAKDQQSIAITANAKSIRLDVYVEDEENSVYDIEMQATKKKNLPKRSRYYQGIIDLNLIEKGADYNSLKKSYVIFICLTDPFDEGRHIYTFENRCRQNSSLLLGDETTKVFINASGTQDDVSPEMADFLLYLREGVGNSNLVKKIDREVQSARDHKEWRTEYMTLQMKLDEAREEGKEEGRFLALQDLVSAGVISIEMASEMMGISKEEFSERVKNLNEE